MLRFEAGQLQNVLDQLHQDGFTGAAYVEVAIDAQQTVRSQVVFFQDGSITFVGKTLPNPHEFSEMIGEKLKLKVMAAALQLAQKKVKHPDSLQDYLAIYLRLDLFKWDALEKAMRSDIVLHLDQLWPYAGTVKTDDQVQFDLAYGPDRHGFNWQQLCLSLAQRQQAWASLAPAVPSMDAIPHPIMPDHIQLVDDDYAQEHLKVWINGQRSLLEIAEGLERDPLELGHLYLHWQKMNWVTFTGKPAAYGDAHRPSPGLAQLPLILSVDDSLVVQTMLKRTLCDRYRILTASNAVDALSLLNQHPIELMLLDVTMPDIDGFEFCRTVRGISKFRDLPVIMLTAKDGLVNKVKGQMAGSTHYLTKPVQKDLLLKTIEKYIPAVKVAH